MKKTKGGKRRRGPNYKKSHLVYAVVGAACCNKQFRDELFAQDPTDAAQLEQFLDRFTRETGAGQQVIPPADLEQIKKFIDPRSIKPKHRSFKKATRAPLDEITFATACETFALQVCPFWPCDDY